MISDNESKCPKCNGELKYYDSVKRLVRTKYGMKNTTNIERVRCLKYGSVHRVLPNYLFPYKQYESDIIIGVCEGYITCETLGFEDNPCEITMIRWKTSQNLQYLVCRKEMNKCWWKSSGETLMHTI